MKLKAKKSLGQNFLTDESIIDEVLTVADVQLSDQVFEIGPGTGALTLRLVPRVGKLLCVELDQTLAKRLRDQFPGSKKVTVITGDILTLHVAEALKTAGFSETPYKVIANIPYYITAPIIRLLLALPVRPQSLTLMVQAEVADRLVAKPGEMSLLSLMAQISATVEKKIVVPREAFDPVPGVDSAVVHIVPYSMPEVAQEKAVFRLARAGFSARRKTLANNLATSFAVPRNDIESLLQASGLRTDIRAQALSVEDWQRLSKQWQQSGYE